MSKRVVAFTALAVVALLPVLTKATLGDRRANLLTGGALLILALLLGLRFDRNWLRAPASHILGGLLVVCGIFIVAWQWQVADLWINGQLLLYAGVAAAFVACVSWFRRQAPTVSDALTFLFELKVGAVIGASVLILVAVFNIPDDPGALSNLVHRAPIYGHIRHFNNDQVPAIAVSLYFLSRTADRWGRVLWFVALVLMGLLLAWSGGRGAVLSLGVFLALIAGYRVVPRRIIMLWCAALILGVALVFISGRADDLLLARLARIGGDANQLTSNRLDIWLESLDIWRQDWLSVIFGFGPDAILNTVRWQFTFSTPIFQVHNSVIQVLLEFGVIGLCVFAAGLFFLARRIFWFLRTPSAPRLARLTAALLVAFFVYSLVTGIIYHAIPLSFVMFLAAYLFHFDPEVSILAQTEETRA